MYTINPRDMTYFYPQQHQRLWCVKGQPGFRAQRTNAATEKMQELNDWFCEKIMGSEFCTLDLLK